MRQSEEATYRDSEDFEELGERVKYPCNTQYMTYNALLHRYHLTNEGLLHYGIDAEKHYISTNPNKIDERIRKTSKKVYDYINYKAGVSR